MKAELVRAGKVEYATDRSDAEKRTRLLEAETRASMWLANGNEFAEKGNQKRAEECYSKGQYWLDRANKLGMDWSHRSIGNE